MPPDGDVSADRRLRHCDALLDLLAIDPEAELGAALDAAARLVAGALEADLVNVLFHDAASGTLVDVVQPSSRVGRVQRGSGLDRVLLADVGLAGTVFRDGRSRVIPHYDRVAELRPEVVETLGLLSGIGTRIQADGTARGVLTAGSISREWFGEADQRFLGAAARWMGLVAVRADLSARLARSAAAAGDARRRDEVHRLTRRERQVAVLVAEGLTNEEIARRLVVVPGTIGNHIEHILSKLGFTRRVQIATWSLQVGLWPPPPELSVVAPADLHPAVE